jgi:hypothetical protein
VAEVKSVAAAATSTSAAAKVVRRLRHADRAGRGQKLHRERAASQAAQEEPHHRSADPQGIVDQAGFEHTGEQDQGDDDSQGRRNEETGYLLNSIGSLTQHHRQAGDGKDQSEDVGKAEWCDHGCGIARFRVLKGALDKACSSFPPSCRRKQESSLTRSWHRTCCVTRQSACNSSGADRIDRRRNSRRLSRGSSDCPRGP